MNYFLVEQLEHSAALRVSVIWSNCTTHRKTFFLLLSAIYLINVLSSKPKSDFSRIVQPEQNFSELGRQSVQPGGVLLCSSSSSAKVGLSSRYCWASDQVVRYVTLAMLSKMFFRASQFLFLSCLACSWKQEEESTESAVRQLEFTLEPK